MTFHLENARCLGVRLTVASVVLVIDPGQACRSLTFISRWPYTDGKRSWQQSTVNLHLVFRRAGVLLYTYRKKIAHTAHSHCVQLPISAPLCSTVDCPTAAIVQSSPHTFIKVNGQDISAQPHFGCPVTNQNEGERLHYQYLSVECCDEERTFQKRRNILP